MDVELFGSAEPPAGPLGETWRAIAGQPPYLSVRHGSRAREVAVADDLERWSGEQITAGNRQPVTDAGALLVLRMEPLPDVDDEFNAWYDTEHIARFSQVDGFLDALRYRALSGAPRYAALYYLRDPSVCTSPEWRAAADTPWSARMRVHTRSRQRGLFVPYSDQTHAVEFDNSTSR